MAATFFTMAEGNNTMAGATITRVMEIYVRVYWDVKVIEIILTFMIRITIIVLVLACHLSSF